MVVTRSGAQYDLTIPPKPKQPRAPSEYNIFMKDTLEALKVEGITDHRMRFKIAAEMWNRSRVR